MPDPNFPAGGNAPVIPVSLLARRVRDCLESQFPLLWVGGEISNLTQAASGHVYFSLKDASAQVRCVMWRSRAQLLGWRLENGQKIEARALVSFYEARGEFQLSVEAIRRAGQGDLFERFLRLKAQLEAEGLFAPEGKRLLPAFPRRLAIVTSPQAAALRDVLATLRRRAPHLRLSLYPTLVQGEGAAAGIAAAIARAASGEHDLILLCRGGGSIEDLWAFNEEAVARAIRASTLPVVTGIGHETDFTIADFAADLRAPTPTAAAELASPDRDALLARLDELHARLQRRLRHRLDDGRLQLDRLALRLRHPAERLQERRDEVATLGRRLLLASQAQIRRQRQELRLAGQSLQHARPDAQAARIALLALQQRLRQACRQQFSLQTMKLNALRQGLSQLNPHAVLARGYALALGPDGKPVTDAATLAPGSTLQLSFARGSAEAAVTRVVAAGEAD